MGQQKKRRLLRVGLAALALTAGAALLLLLRPPCLILESTGYYCGACGVTRLVEELPHTITLLPVNGGSDGFYAARFRRKGDL